MGYTTYKFYTEEFYGDVIPSESFDKWNERASTKLDYLCGGNITAESILKYPTQIQKATCGIAEVLYQIDENTKNANDPKLGNIKSMSSGGQSVTFSSSDSILVKATSDRKTQNKLLLDIASEYLDETGLLYMGC